MEPKTRKQLIPALLVAAIPCLLVTLLVFFYGLDAPLIDQWSMVEDLQKYYNGDWGPGDWIRSHNGHRLVIPRLILVPLAHFTAWNTRAEMALGLLFALGTFALFARSALRAAEKAEVSQTGTSRGVWILPVIALAIFSLNQWQNWLWGLQMHVFLAVFAAVAGLALLTAERSTWGNTLGAAGCGLVATFSQGTGLVFWPVGFVILTLRLFRGGARAWARLGFWSILSIAVITVYLQPFPGDAGVGELDAFFLEYPLTYFYYVLTLLGAPVVSFADATWPPREFGAGFSVALLGLAGYAFSVLVLWAYERPELERLGHFFACALFSLGVAAQIGLGRASFGAAQAMDSRYMTLTTPFWVGLAVCLFFAAGALRGPERRERRIGLGLRLGFAGLVVLMIASSLVEVPRFSFRYSLLAPARTAMIDGQNEELLGRLHIEVHQVYGGLGVLQYRQLSAFRDAERKDPPRAKIDEPLEHFGQIIVLRSELESLTAGERHRAVVAVTNPTLETWPTRGRYVVHFSYNWFDEERKKVVQNGLRTELPYDLAPGDTVELEAEIEAPEEPGRHLLRLTMVQENRAWFSDERARPLDLEVDVLPRE